MSIDTRTRLNKDVRPIELDEVLDSLLPDAIAAHGELAGRGVAYKELPSLGLDVDGRCVTLHLSRDSLVVQDGLSNAGVVASLAPDALSDLLQDAQSTMGLAMTSRVKIVAGNINDWIGWEPALRALLDGRKVHETGDVTFADLDGEELDLDRSFTVGDDREEVAHFLEQAGYLHIRNVFDESEMAAIASDIDEWIAKATPDDGESWWAVDENGVEQAVRVLFFYEKSAGLPRFGERRSLSVDRRSHWRRPPTQGQRGRPGQAAWDRSGTLRSSLAQRLRSGPALV